MKEKQIGEMAKIIMYCPFIDADSQAKELYEKGYRKISKDAVVMSKEKYQELFIKAQKSATQWIDLEREEKIRKQTAREILQEFEYCNDTTFYAKWLELCKQYGVEVK